MPSRLSHIRNKQSVTSALEEARAHQTTPRIPEVTDGEEDTFLISQATFSSGVHTPRKSRSWQIKNVLIAFLVVVAILSLTDLLYESSDLSLLSAAGQSKQHVDKFVNVLTSGGARSKTKAIVIASYTGQKTEWVEQIPNDWEIHRYENDNPLADLTVPRNQGREAMSYLTYIIDNYDNLPNYILFFHGHYTSWHQIAPTPKIVQNLNLSAVDANGWVSLRCGWEPSCSPSRTWLNTTGPHLGHHPVVPILPHFFRYLFPNEDEVPMPPIFAAPCCAQFAVSKRAVRLRSKEFWIKARAPLLRDLTEFRSWGSEFDTWHAGVLYERMWHYFFGMPAFHCVPEEQCLAEYYQGKFQGNSYEQTQEYSGDQSEEQS